MSHHRDREDKYSYKRSSDSTYSHHSSKKSRHHAHDELIVKEEPRSGSKYENDRLNHEHKSYHKIKKEPQEDPYSKHSNYHNVKIEKNSNSTNNNELVPYKSRHNDANEEEDSGSFNKSNKGDKEKPNFELSGKLTEETNLYKGIVIKYSEPPEARKPEKIRWRLYPFKKDEELPVMYIHRQSAYLIGRERKVADIPIDHPSCSKQHAAIQFRLVNYKRGDGSEGRRIKPYIIDLESSNGTFVNGNQIESKRYVELFEKDVLKFGFSSREYVLLHENSKEKIVDDEPSPDKSSDEEEKSKKNKKSKKSKKED